MNKLSARIAAEQGNIFSAEMRGHPDLDTLGHVGRCSLFDHASRSSVWARFAFGAGSSGE